MLNKKDILQIICMRMMFHLNVFTLIRTFPGFDGCIRHIFILAGPAATVFFHIVF